MSNSEDIRWRQRLENFGKALARLQLACGQDEYSELERAGLVQMFEFSFELAWKTLKDLLFVEGLDAKSPREVIRKSLSTGYLSADDTELFLDALSKRNLLSHLYEEKIVIEATALIKNDYTPLLLRVQTTLQNKCS